MAFEDTLPASAKTATEGDRSLAHTSAGQPTFDALQLFKDHKDSVVRIGEKQQFGPNQLESTLGTGFVIANDKEHGTLQIGTADHVVTGDHKLFVENSRGDKLPATVLSEDKQNDLAILNVKAKIDLSWMAPLGLSAEEKPVAKDEPVVKISARTGTLSYDQGTADEYFQRQQAQGLDLLPGENPNRTMIAISGDGQGGDSGGPLLNAAGIVVAIDDASGPGVIAGTPAHYLRNTTDAIPTT